MLTKLERIAEIAKERPDEKFTSLIHLIDKEMLIKCHYELKRNKAPGIDKITKNEYEINLEENIENLLQRMKAFKYRPNPVKRVYIPKAGTDKKRPLGIPSYEDKIVQLAITKILSAIYEQDFLDCSFGFRPKRSCHDAIKILDEYLSRRRINYVVDADIKGFFDHVDHRWLMKFLEHRIKDKNLLRYIARFLNAGIMENGQFYKAYEGTPQGGIISPLLANIYLHYVLDLWFEKVVRKRCRGQAYIVRYADDFVCCFEYKNEAEAFYEALKLRLAKFNLEIAEDKTKIIYFGSKAYYESKRCDPWRGKKPETFDFLGFTHYCSECRDGRFRVKRKTSKKKFANSLKKFKIWLKNNRTLPKDELMDKLRIKLNGYFRYYGITDNIKSIDNFRYLVRRYLFKWLNRRSQRRSYNWDKFQKFLNIYPLPKPRIYVNIFELDNKISYIM